MSNRNTSKQKKKQSLILALGLAAMAGTFAIVNPAAAADKKSAPVRVDPKAAPAPEEKTVDPLTGAEKVSVEGIKEKYWARGDETEMGVVQNRLYTKTGKFQIGMFVGTLTTDPFLDVRNVGGLVGYHFSEYFSANVLYWRSYASLSGAGTYVQQQYAGLQAPSNLPAGYLGGEGSWNALYGKLSVVGKAIVYYDMNLMAGLGATATESGNNLTEHVGIGQKVYLAKSIALRLDYRLMHYHESLLNKVTGNPLYGTPFGDRENWTHSIILGVDFLIGGGKQ